MIPGSPAEEAGIMIGDSVVKVGDDLVLFMELTQVDTLLSSPQLSLILTVERFNI